MRAALTTLKIVAERRHARSGARARVRAFAAGLGAAAICLMGAPVALASHSQVSILQDDVNLLRNPGPMLQQMRHIGVEMVRVTVRWSSVAPVAGSRHRPRFDASNPNAYPAANWAPYDTVVRDAEADGIKVLFVPSGFAPLWAQGPSPGRYAAHYRVYEAFEPSAGQYGQFVQALGTRYSGSFRPPGSSSALPRVSYWELYNEPNFGEDIAPQAIDGSRVLYAPKLYRALADAGWAALGASGHGSDTILIGALAARGAQAGPGRLDPQGLPGTYGETKPIQFILGLYCLDPSFHPYRGVAAAVRGCPTTAVGTSRFRARNPVLFEASGFSDHPYPKGSAPNLADSRDPSYGEFSELPRLGSTLDRIQRIYHSGKRFPLWDTEFGYITNPPNRSHTYVSPSTAAYYLNWTEYLSWRNPRIASTMQYLLYDPNPTVGTPEYGGFASGLVFYSSVHGGQPKPGYFAYRMPIFLPSTSTHHGRTLEVWGDVRPAAYAAADTQQPQYVQIQFAPGASRSWSTLKTLEVTDPHGYFDVRVAFPSSGSVRIAWTYPPLDAALGSNLVTGPTDPTGPSGYVEPLAPTTSRTVKVTIT